MNDQKRLAYIVQQLINPEEWRTLRGIIANWEDQTLGIKFFLVKKLQNN